MKQRVWYADIIRIIAIGMVVVIHVASKDFQRVPIDSFHWQFLNALNGFSRIAVPLFFMVSGMFFLNPEKSFSISNLYRKSIYRLIRVFLFWSVVYVLFEKMINTEPLLEGEVEDTILEIIQGYFHLWFLYRLAEVYIMVPLLRPITKRWKLTLYFLILSFIVGIIVPTLKQFPISSTDTLVDSGINLDITIGYAGYMVAGYALSRYNLPSKWKKGIYLAGIIGFFVTIGATSLISLQQNDFFDLFYEYLTPNVLASSLAAFLFVKEKLENKQFTVRQEHWLRLFSRYSFGVYLSHVLIRNIIWEGGINTTLFTPILSVPFLSIVIIISSATLTGVFMQIPWLKKTVT